MACLLLSPVPGTLAGELERVRESYNSALKAHEKRITLIEASGRGGLADSEKRADGITRGRIADIKASWKPGAATGKSLADLAETASGDVRALDELYRAQSERLGIVLGEWDANGAERKRLQEAIAGLQKNLAVSSANLASAADAAKSMQTRVPESNILEEITRIEPAVDEARERLAARWAHERAAREREREQREREAGERTRTVR